mmetsp:Transcript_2704/g.4894  ORF Transcript_2704/g.4894 Transcript_2704/m.4894 type:complete len:633 (+) Transcript_2704:408-2306(+)
MMLLAPLAARSTAAAGLLPTRRRSRSTAALLPIRRRRRHRRRIGIAPLHKLSLRPRSLLNQPVIVLHRPPAVGHVGPVDLAGVLSRIAVVIHPFHFAYGLGFGVIRGFVAGGDGDGHGVSAIVVVVVAVVGFAPAAAVAVVFDARPIRFGILPAAASPAAPVATASVSSVALGSTRLGLGLAGLLPRLAVHLTPLAPNAAEHAPVLVLHLPLPVRTVILVDVARVPSVPAVLVAVLHVLDAYLLLATVGGGVGRREGPAGFVGGGLAAGVVEDAAGAAGGATADAAGVGGGVVGAVGADVVEDLPASQCLLLGQPDTGMRMAVPLLVERQGPVPIRLPPTLPARIAALRAPLGPRTPHAAPGTKARRAPPGIATGQAHVVRHVVVLRIETLGTLTELLPSSQQLLLGDLDRGVFRAASVLVEFASGGFDGLGAGGHAPPGGFGRDRVRVPVAPVVVLRTRFATRGATGGPAVVHADLVPIDLDAPGTRLADDLPPSPRLLGRHLHGGMVVTPSLVVEGRVELHVHVTAVFGGGAERVGHAVDGAAPFDLAGAAQGRDAAGFVVFRGAFGAVHFQLPPHEFTILLHLLGQLNRFMLHAISIQVECRSVKCRFRRRKNRLSFFLVGHAASPADA